MDFFEVFPHLRAEQDASLKGRALRLLALFGIAYDDAAYYFELSRRRYWVRSAAGHVTLGVGGAQVHLDSPRAPLKSLAHHIREAWLSEPEIFPGGPLYLLEGDRCVVLSGTASRTLLTPHILILTPPRLGGAKMPDALVQAAYFLHLRKPPTPAGVPGLLRVERASLGDFLAHEQWPLRELLSQPWAAMLSSKSLPAEAILRPVLSLRGLRRLWQERLFPLDRIATELEGNP